MTATLIGRDARTRALHETPLPPAYAADAMPGAQLLGADGRIYRSERYPTFADPYQWISTAEIAEDVAADVFRAIDQNLILVVDPALSEIEGERYQSLGEALSFLSRYQPVYRANWYDPGVSSLRVRIELAAGFVLDEQIQFNGVDLGWVGIHAIDPTVTVVASSLTKFTSGPATLVGSHATISGGNGAVLPIFIGLRFQCDGSTVPVDPSVGEVYTPKSSGLLLGRAIASIQSTRFRADGVTVLSGGARPGGFDNFVRNIFVRAGGDFNGFGFTAHDADEYGVIVEATAKATLSYCMINGSGVNSVRAAGSSVVTGGPYITAPENYITGFYDQDFRKTSGVDSAADIVAAANASINISNPGARGGLNIPAWSALPQGYITDARAPALPIVSGIIKPQPYTVATAPSASAYIGHEIYVSNGAAGLPIVAFSDGTNWLRCDTRTPISAT